MFTPRQRFWKRYFYRRLNKAFTKAYYRGNNGCTAYFIVDHDMRFHFRCCLHQLVNQKRLSWLKVLDAFINSRNFPNNVLDALIRVLKENNLNGPGEGFWSWTD